jgi:hypothetical protein
MIDPVVPLLLRVVVAAVAIVVLATTYADADLWGHVRFGLDMVAAQTVRIGDRYSFTSDRPWINHEWLAEAAMAMAYRAGGSIGLIGLRVALVAGVYAVVWASLRARMAGWARCAILLYVIVGIAWATATVRPQLFSLLLFALLLASLVRAGQGSRAATLWWPPIMIVWVNAHGGWVVGLGTLGIWCAFAIARARSRERVVIIAALVTAGLATLVNPYGAGMWQFIAATVRLGRDIAEWQPIASQPWSHVAVWMVSLAIALVALGSPRSSDRGSTAGLKTRGSIAPHVAIAAAFACASWQVARLDAFFCLAVAMLLAPRLAPARGAIGAPAARPAIAWVPVAISALAIGWPVTRHVRTQLPCIEIAGAWTPDAEAARFIELERLRGRMLTWFDWGEYALWHFGPDLQVSMDGRRETVYSSGMIEAHFAFYRGEAEGRGLPRRLGADYLWLPRALPAAHAVAADGWHPVFEGSRSIIFALSSEKIHRGGNEPPSRRCFPGP